MAWARRQNPHLFALRARERSSVLSVRESRTAYTPSLNLSTGWGGYTQRQADTDALINGARGGAASQYESCLANNYARQGAGLA